MVWWFSWGVGGRKGGVAVIGSFSLWGHGAFNTKDTKGTKGTKKEDQTLA